MDKVYTLHMYFASPDVAQGKTLAISIPHVKPDVTAAAVTDAMDAMIAADVFVRQLTSKVGAEVTAKEVRTLI